MKPRACDLLFRAGDAGFRPATSAVARQADRVRFEEERHNYKPLTSDFARSVGDAGFEPAASAV
jgi:hypothetical protein